MMIFLADEERIFLNRERFAIEIKRMLEYVRPIQQVKLVGMFNLKYSVELYLLYFDESSETRVYWKCDEIKKEVEIYDPTLQQMRERWYKSN